ncbi:hypothetical protein TRFO_10372 [Tritrichomonas foetus]|uniref:Uncharacterized protein n=1 Tax=Tritrichomonas foetus TaxID=1144522 RepID=A0A1J4JEN5_9EUKA|nr:hypothetical protein TRFO_10372 [Tritrichomonas foetus]|eukprot:OHS95724.1 hypothetical protein TRFO_10372 [Tritrichomonas foetus]
MNQVKWNIAPLNISSICVYGFMHSIESESLNDDIRKKQLLILSHKLAASEVPAIYSEIPTQLFPNSKFPIVIVFDIKSQINSHYIEKLNISSWCKIESIEWNINEIYNKEYWIMFQRGIILSYFYKYYKLKPFYFTSFLLFKGSDILDHPFILSVCPVRVEGSLCIREIIQPISEIIFSPHFSPNVHDFILAPPHEHPLLIEKIQHNEIKVLSPSKQNFCLQKNNKNLILLTNPPSYLSFYYSKFTKPIIDPMKQNSYHDALRIKVSKTVSVNEANWLSFFQQKQDRIDKINLRRALKSNPKIQPKKIEKDSCNEFLNPETNVESNPAKGHFFDFIIQFEKNYHIIENKIDNNMNETGNDNQQKGNENQKLNNENERIGDFDNKFRDYDHDDVFSFFDLKDDEFEYDSSLEALIASSVDNFLLRKRIHKTLKSCSQPPLPYQSIQIIDKRIFSYNNLCSDFLSSNIDTIFHSFVSLEEIEAKRLRIPFLHINENGFISSAPADQLLSEWPEKLVWPISGVKNFFSVVFNVNSNVSKPTQIFFKYLRHYYSMYNFGKIKKIIGDKFYHETDLINLHKDVNSFIASLPSHDFQLYPIICFIVRPKHKNTNYFSDNNIFLIDICEEDIENEEKGEKYAKRLVFQIYSKIRLFRSTPQSSFDNRLNNTAFRTLFGYKHQPPFLLKRKNEQECHFHIIYCIKNRCMSIIDDIGSIFGTLTNQLLNDIVNITVMINHIMEGCKIDYTLSIFSNILKHNEFVEIQNYFPGIPIFTICLKPYIQTVLKKGQNNDYVIFHPKEDQIMNKILYKNDVLTPVKSCIIVSNAPTPYEISLYSNHPEDKIDSIIMNFCSQISNLSWFSVAPGKPERLSSLPIHLLSLLEIINPKSESVSPLFFIRKE